MSTPARPNPADSHPFDQLPSLSQEEAAERLRRDGPNRIAEDARTPFLRALWGVVTQPMFLLLLAAGALYLVLGELTDALTLLAFVVGVIGLTLYQDRRSERAVSALRDLSAPTARVVRGGLSTVIPSADVVAGDLVLLAEGERVPADGVLIDGRNVRVDESLLTGESVPVDKHVGPDDAALAAPSAESSGSVFGSTLVVSGSGAARVRATGPRTAVGKIGRVLADTHVARSPLSVEVAALVKRIALLGGALCVLLVIAISVLQADPLRGLLAGITLAMAILPEEFPVVLTVFTTLGAFRIAKLGVLARRPEAIEALGSARVLCVDKTGTITENRMRVAELWPFDHDVLALGRAPSGALPEAVHELLEFALLASPADSADPMERALRELGGTGLAGTEHLHGDYVREEEYPLTRALLAVSYVLRAPGAPQHVVASKGAPEAIVDLCHLDAAAAARVLAQVERMAARGLRVLGVARAELVGEHHPAHQHDFAFRFAGLVAFEDPVRSSVPGAVARFRAAGVRVVMITGDHASTARAIAAQAGLDLAGGVCTLSELAELPEDARADRVARVNVFARVTPEGKLMLVRALAARGEIVAMTGDGVNDAPALKAAQIGIALGARATDVAREAAALVLTGDDFGTIADAMVLGRRIYENLRRAMLYVIAVHVPIAALSLLPVLLGEPALLLPVHVMFLEMIIDPACTLAFEAETPDAALLARPSRRVGDSLFDRRSLVTGVLQGSVLGLAVLGLYTYALRSQASVDVARATAFSALVLGNLALIAVQRSRTRSAFSEMFRSKNAAATWVTGLATLALVLMLVVPGLRHLAHFALPPAALLGWALVTGLASVLWFDATKWRRQPR